jgi:hypothetical protein
MRKEDSIKLLKAGYTFIRADKASKTIKTLSHNGQFSHGWKTLEKGFATMKEVEKRMNELLMDEKTLEG